MKRIAIAAAVLISASIGAPAHAGNDQYDFDLIHRPAGITEAQVDAGVQAATQTCDPSGSHSYGSRRFLSCMRSRGYKFVRIEHQGSPSGDPNFSANVKLAPGHFISHDTGMDCQQMGGADVCTPPNGTVRYYDPDQGLPCTRTGAVAICSNM
jgi:hypothetical protein